MTKTGVSFRVININSTLTCVSSRRVCRKMSILIAVKNHKLNGLKRIQVWKSYLKVCFNYLPTPLSLPSKSSSLSDNAPKSILSSYVKSSPTILTDCAPGGKFLSPGFLIGFSESSCSCVISSHFTLTASLSPLKKGTYYYLSKWTGYFTVPSLNSGTVHNQNQFNLPE